MRQLRTVLALTAAALFTLAGVALPTPVGQSASATTTADPTPPKKLFTIKDDRIKDPSGLAKSQNTTTSTGRRTRRLTASGCSASTPPAG